MKSSLMLGAVLSTLFATAPAMADDDFRALGPVSGATAMTEERLEAVEGGLLNCVIGAVNICPQTAVAVANSNITQSNVNVLGGALQGNAAGVLQVPIALNL
jgi:hypothetical protein